MPDILIAWYPLFKFLVGLTFVGILVLLGKHKMYKSFVAIMFLSVIVGYTMPVRIDGTNTADNHKITESYQQTKYKEIERETPLTMTPTPTFQQRMEAENNRSNKANAEVQKEVNRDGKS